MNIHTPFNSIPLNPIPNQTNPVHTVTPNLLKIKCHIILPSRPEFPIQCSCFQTKMIMSCITHATCRHFILCFLQSTSSFPNILCNFTFLQNSTSIPYLPHNFYEWLNLLHLPSCKNSPLCHFLCITFK